MRSLVYIRILYNIKKLSNTNKNTDEKKLVSKLQGHLPIEYFLAIFICIHRLNFLSMNNKGITVGNEGTKKMTCHYYR